MDKTYETLMDFAEHYTDYVPDIPVLKHIPTANEFLSGYAIPSKPFIINIPENHLPAVARWMKPFYLESKLGDVLLDGSIIPNHLPDPIQCGRYVEPEIRKMYGSSLLNEMGIKMRNPFGQCHFVKQANNLKEFSTILDDIQVDIPWATEALGDPIAANLSIGTEVNFTPLHRDEYENFFYVVKGTRKFKLLPPIANVCLPYKKFKKFQWQYNVTLNDLWVMKDLNEEIDFIPTIIEPETVEKNGFYRRIKSYQVEIHPGEALYIPSLWYHEYYQSDACFTLNYRYDIKWDWKCPFINFLSKLFQIKSSMFQDASVDTQTELEEKLKDLLK